MKNVGEGRGACSASVCHSRVRGQADLPTPSASAGWTGGGVCLSTLRPYVTLHPIGLHGCGPRRKPLLKMMHNAEDQQTVDMDYWNHVLWFDETKSNFFG